MSTLMSWRVTLLGTLLFALPNAAAAQATVADYQRAMGLREKYPHGQCVSSNSAQSGCSEPRVFAETAEERTVTRLG